MKYWLWKIVFKNYLTKPPKAVFKLIVIRIFFFSWPNYFSEFSVIIISALTSPILIACLFVTAVLFSQFIL